MFRCAPALLTAGLLLVAAICPPGLAGAQSSRPQEYTANVLGGEPDTLDPSRAAFATEMSVIRQVFEPLLRTDSDLRPQPAAAERYEASPGDLVWTFHLRPDGRFSDGTPVTAADFEYAFKRMLDPAIASSSAAFLVDAGITGAREYNAGETTSPDEVGVRALDPLTLQVTLLHPIGYLPSLLTLPALVPLRRNVIEVAGEQWAQNPDTYIGNGPFVLTEWAHQDHITLAPNAAYHGPGPTLQKMTFLMLQDDTVDYLAYVNGERDETVVPDVQVAAVRSDPVLSREAHLQTFLGTSWLYLNVARPPLDNLLVRKAFTRAIDRQAYVRDIAGGLGKPATSLIPPGMPGYQPELGQELGFNAQASRALLDQAGYRDPARFPGLTFSYAAGTDGQRRAEFIQAQLRQNLGIEVQLKPMDSRAFEAAYQAKSFDLALGGWLADYPDPHDWLRTNFGCGGDNNPSNYCNPAFDTLVQQADSSLDQAERLRLYARAQQVLVDDAAGVWLLYVDRLMLVKPYVEGLTFTGQDEYPGDLFLDQVQMAAR